jgi:threonine/homoserine/homoserine lactone efflux protein
MGRLLAQVLPLAVGAAVSPVVLVLQVRTLAGPRPRRNGVVFAAGAAVPLLVAAVVVLTIGRAIELPKESAETKAVIDLVLGAFLVLLGLRAVLRPPVDRVKPATAPAHQRRPFMLGMVAMLTNFTTLALFVPAMKLLAAGDISTEDRVLAAVLVFLITLAPALVPLGLASISPEATTRVLGELGQWMHRHRRALEIGLGFGFGAYLLLKGGLELY